MDFLKKMVDLEEDRKPAPNEAQETQLQSLDKDVLVERCVALTRDAQEKTLEYASLYDETATLRKEYDDLRAKHQAAKKEAPSEEHERFRKERLELESRIATLQATSTTSDSSVSILEQRIEQSERKREETEAAKDEELARMTAKLDVWKEKATAEREGLRREVVELRRRVQESEDDLEAERARARTRRAEAAEAEPADRDKDQSTSAAETAQLTQALQDMEAEVASLKASKKSLQALLDDAQSDNARLQAAHAKELEEVTWEATDTQQKYKELRARHSSVETQVATLDTKNARLEAELEGKEREEKELLRKQEDSFKTEIRVLQETSTSLKDELAETHKKLSDLGSNQALEANDSGSKQAHLTEQLMTTQDNLKAQMLLAEKTSADLKLRTERLSAVEEELKELREELARRDTALTELRTAASDYSQRLSSMDDQSVETLRALQLREEEMETVERQRHALRQQLSTAEATLGQRDATIAAQEAAMAELSLQKEQQMRTHEKAEYGTQELRLRIDTLEEQKQAMEVLQAKREEEAVDVKRRLADRETKIEEVLRMKDDLSARVRGLEMQQRDTQDTGRTVPSTSALRSNTAHTQRSKSVRSSSMPSKGPAGSTGPGFMGTGWGKGTTILGFVVVVWLVGMFHSFSANTGDGASPVLEMEKIAVHLRATLDSTERALQTCRSSIETAKAT